MDSRSPIAKWAKTNSEVRHYASIGQQCLKAMTAMQPYLSVTLRNKSVVQGWLEGLLHEDDAEGEALAPRAWRGSIILQDDIGEMELDFLEVRNVRSAPGPIRMFGDTTRDR
jgi:hypothetical protein